MKYQVGDKVKLIKNYGALLKDMEGYIVCIPTSRNTRITLGVDFKIDFRDGNHLGYYNEEGKYVRALKQPTGSFIYQSYVKLVGTPDGQEDWI
jgi:hypothetical protein